MALETGGFGADPSPNGSGYLPVWAEELSEITDAQELLETNYQTGREWSTEVEVGADGAEISFKLALPGLSSAAGDGTNASSVADDALDLIFEHIFGSVRTTAGEGITSASGSVLTASTDAYNAQDPVLVYQSGLSGMPRAQIRTILADGGAGAYTLDSAFEVAPNASGTIYGAKIYTPNSPLAGGNTLSVVYVDDDIGTYRLSGGRITSFSLDGEINQRVMASISIRFDAQTEEGSVKTSLPDALSAPASKPIQLRYSPLRFDGAGIDLSKFSLDFGLTTAVLKDNDQPNGRGGDEVMMMKPVLKVSPLRSESLRTLKRAATTGELSLQLGSGILNNGKIGTQHIRFTNAQMVAFAAEDDEGFARVSIDFEAKDNGSIAPLHIARF